MTLSPSKQQSAGLPDPALNPSLNQTLARNLGRWAEVYFTTPPEERDHAVQKLLQELLEAEQKRLGRWRASGATEEVGALRETPEAFVPEASQHDASPAPALEASTLEVANPASPREPVHKPAGEDALFLVSSEATLIAGPIPAPEAVEVLPDALTVFAVDATAPVSATSAGTDPDSLVGVEEISRIVRPVTEYRPPAVSSSWRRITALAAGILLCAGGTYVVMRSTGSGKRSAPRFDDVNMSLTHKGPGQTGASPGLPVEALPVAPVTASQQPGLVQNAAAREAESLFSLTPKEDGAQELAMAERYRMGRGVAQDSAQAVHWLWLAVAKENVSALERLAGMYAAGEGVAQDCDQARVLAGAAAQKNPKGAASVLQELRAAGCE